MDNINKKKFITDKDAEIERLRLKDELLKQKRGPTLEPYWNDLNEDIQAVSKSREVGAVNRHGKAAVLKQTV
jgi:hypothetical protein